MVVNVISLEENILDISFCILSRLRHLDTTEKMFLQAYKVIL
jgi:hypothetical protein